MGCNLGDYPPSHICLVHVESQQDKIDGRSGTFTGSDCPSWLLLHCLKGFEEIVCGDHTGVFFFFLRTTWAIEFHKLFSPWL